jgi:hypothetical protein
VAKEVVRAALPLWRGTHQLFYFGTSTLPTGVSNLAASPLYRWNQGETHQVELDALRLDTAPSPPTIYVSAANPLRIYRQSL